MDLVDEATRTIDNATNRTIDNNEVRITTLVVLVRFGKGNDVTIHQEDCRPAERGAVLDKFGINVGHPLRSPRYAYAWLDGNGVLNVGGTSERGKECLRRMYYTFVFLRDDIEIF